MFLFFLAAIFGLNFYDWWKLRNAFCRPHSNYSQVIFLLIFGLLTVPILMHLYVPSARRWRYLELAPNIWLAWSLWLGTLFFLLDLWNLGCHLCHAPALNVPARIGGFAGLGLLLLCTIWGVIEANSLRIRKIDLSYPGAPPNGYKIALISDVHIGVTINPAKAQKIIRLINELHPDLLLSAGDFIDGGTKRDIEIVGLFQQLAVPENRRYGVLGNHDCYIGVPFSSEMHTRAGFTLLNNETVLIDNWLSLTGEMDPAVYTRGNIKKTDDKENGSPDNTFAIRLFHRPAFTDEIAQRFNLQLSGHSHGGQVFPFTLLVRLQYPYRESRLHQITDRFSLYVSRGTGTWNPPFRVLAPPEITLFTITR